VPEVTQQGCSRTLNVEAGSNDWAQLSSTWESLLPLLMNERVGQMYTQQGETVVDAHQGDSDRSRCFEPRIVRSKHRPSYDPTPVAACLYLIRFIKPPALMISRISGGYGLIWKV
jgi:hypothetical protein